MVDDRHEMAMVVRGDTLPERNKPSNSRIIAVRRGEDLADDFVSHLTPTEVRSMVDEAAKNPRHGKRNAAILSVIYDGTLRVSECLGLRPCDVITTPDGHVVRILGKGKRPGEAAITADTANRLLAIAYNKGNPIPPTEKLFPITRSQVFRICQDAYTRAGVRQPSKAVDRVGCVHILRHSGALARLAASGNPKSVQAQLRHKSAGMTMRYWKTLTIKEGLKIQEGVNPW